jgi:tetratricopeptide (TPR) repeat protein
MAMQGESAPLLNAIASTHLAVGEWSDAIGLLARATDMDPASAPPHFNRAYAEFADGRLDPALASVRRAIALDAKNPRFFYYLSLMLEQAGDTVGAAEALSQCLRLDPQHREASIYSAYHALEQGDTERALGIAEATVRAHPDAIDAVELQAQIQLLRMQTEQALATLSDALSRHPQAVELLVVQGQVLLATQRHDEALVQLRRAVALQPNNEQAQLALGWASLFADDATGARASFDAATRINAANADAWAGIALVQAVNGMSDARQFVDKALQADPDCASALWLRAALTGFKGGEAERRHVLSQFAQLHAFTSAGWNPRESIERAQASPLARRMRAKRQQPTPPTSH